MGRAVYIKKGPGSWIAGSLFLAICAGIVWAVWQAIRWAWRHQARTVAAVTTLVAAAVIGPENVVLIAVVAGAGSVIWWAWWPVSFARWVANPARFVWRRGWYRREWRWLTFGCGLGHRHVEHQVLTHSRQVTDVPKLRRIRCSRWMDRLTFRPLTGFAGVSRPSATPASVACTPDSWVAIQIARPMGMYAAMAEIPSRLSTITLSTPAAAARSQTAERSPA